MAAAVGCGGLWHVEPSRSCRWSPEGWKCRHRARPARRASRRCPPDRGTERHSTPGAAGRSRDRRGHRRRSARRRARNPHAQEHALRCHVGGTDPELRQRERSAAGPRGRRRAPEPDPGIVELARESTSSTPGRTVRAGASSPGRQPERTSCQAKQSPDDHQACSRKGRIAEAPAASTESCRCIGTTSAGGSCRPETPETPSLSQSRGSRRLG